MSKNTMGIVENKIIRNIKFVASCKVSQSLSYLILIRTKCIKKYTSYNL